MENWVIKKTTRGVRLIDGKGYSYTKDRSVGLKSYWRCDYKFWKCKSRASLDGPTDNTLGKTRVMFNLMTHGHPPQMKRLLKKENLEMEDPVKPVSPVKSLLKSRNNAPNKTSPKRNCSSGTEVCLRWNSYQTNMQSVFPNLKDKETFVDVTIYAEGQHIKCHKVILSSCSNYFADILKHTNVHHEAIIMLHGIKFWQIKALIDFIYKGEVNIEHEKLDDLLKAGGELQIKGLLREEKTVISNTEGDGSESEYYVKQDPETPPNEDNDDEDYYPNPEYKKKPTTAPKPRRKRKQNTSPPDPSLLKQVKINLKGTKSRPNIKQPKYYSPDYPEYDPDRCVSPPRIDTDPVFDIDNIKLEPIDMEVAKSPDFFEMDTMMNDSVAESQAQESPQRTEKSSKRKGKTSNSDPVTHTLCNSDLSNDDYVYEDTNIIEILSPEKLNELELAVPSTSKGITDSFTPGKKIVLEGPNNRTIILQRPSKKSEAVYLKDLDQALKDMQAEMQGQNPVIRVRNLPTESTLKKFTSTPLTSILKKGEPTNPPVILKKITNYQAPILKAKLSPPIITEPDKMDPIYIKDEPNSDDDIEDIETLDDEEEDNFEAIDADMLEEPDDEDTSIEHIIVPD